MPSEKEDIIKKIAYYKKNFEIISDYYKRMPKTTIQLEELFAHYVYGSQKISEDLEQILEEYLEDSDEENLPDNTHDRKKIYECIGDILENSGGKTYEAFIKKLRLPLQKKGVLLSNLTKDYIDFMRPTYNKSKIVHSWLERERQGITQILEKNIDLDQINGLFSRASKCKKDMDLVHEAYVQLIEKITGIKVLPDDPADKTLKILNQYISSTGYRAGVYARA